MRLRSLAAILTITLAGTAAAYAELKIDSAKYGAGITVIKGHTSQPGQVVILNKRFKRTSSAKKAFFIFRVPYRPRTCVARLAAGGETAEAPVENCSPQ